MATKAKKEVESEVEVDEETSSDPRVYELGFHLDPELSETEAKKAYGSLKATIEENGAVIAEGEPEKIQLAYTISRSENSGRRDFDAAYFGWIAYEANGVGHEAIADAARLEKCIIRFLDIRTTKEEAKHSAEMRDLREKAPEAASETVSDAELDAAIETATTA
jgi:ribosomal protein S6